MRKLQKTLKGSGISISLYSLRDFLINNKKDPHKWKRRNTSFYTKQKPDIHVKRAHYLKEIFANRNLSENQKWDLVFLDESYCQAHHSLPKTWIPINFDPFDYLPKFGGSRKLPPDLPLGAGERVVILAAGNSRGYIPGSLL